jgi:hypothetical protein
MEKEFSVNNFTDYYLKDFVTNYRVKNSYKGFKPFALKFCHIIFILESKFLYECKSYVLYKLLKHLQLKKIFWVYSNTKEFLYDKVI